MLGNRVIEYSAHAFHFELKRDVLGREQSKIVPLELRLVTVPLTRFPVVAYELPNEIATAVDELFEDQPKSNAPLGRAPARDRARNASLHASAETLPYHYRRRASLAMAYQDLFSQSFLNRAVAFAGSTHSHDLDVEASQTAALAGLVRDASGASLDLGLAGSGDYGGVQADKALIFTVTRSPGRRIRLFDSVGTSNAAPLVLVLMGSSGAALTVQVGSVQRPVVLIGFNVQLEAAPGALWKGAVFLDRTSSFVAGLNGPLRLGHLSYAAGSRRVSAQAVLVDQALPETLEAVSPQVHYAAVNRISL
jgi:hypothetical protein